MNAEQEALIEKIAYRCAEKIGERISLTFEQAIALHKATCQAKRSSKLLHLLTGAVGAAAMAAIQHFIK